MCVSVFLGFHDSGDLDESQGKPFCFCLSLGPLSTPSLSELCSISAVCVYKHRQVMYALNYLVIKMLTEGVQQGDR